MKSPLSSTAVALPVLSEWPVKFPFNWAWTVILFTTLQTLLTLILSLSY